MRESRKRPRRDSLSEDLDREIAFHVEAVAEEYVAQGLQPEAARRRALVEFGGREQVKQQLRDVHTSPLLESLAFHARAAIRFARSAPSLAAAVILTLALGIGANSAVFSAIDAVLLRPLPFPSGDQLLLLNQTDSRQRDPNHFVAPVRLEDWNRLANAFQGITGYYTDDLSEISGPLPERIKEAFVAPRFLQVMGVQPALGRDFTTQEEQFGGPNAVLISYGFWQRRFNGDSSVLGKRLHVGSFAQSIVGIMPASFRFPGRDVDVWSPSPPDAPYAQSRDETWFTAIGRMRPRVTVAEAQANLAMVQRQLGRQFRKPDGDLRVDVEPLKETVVGGVRDSLWLLYGSVSLLLLLACCNIAALLLARTAEREHEISIRFSLGASRRRIVLQLLSEVFALALSGSLLGVVMAAVASQAFHLLSQTLPRAEEITLNWRIVAYSLFCAVATTVLCGLVPAVRGTQRELARSLAQSSRTVSSSSPVQWLLAGVQVMLAVTLLTGAGLLVRSLEELQRVSPGFEPRGVLTFQVTGSYAETTGMARLTQRINRVLEGLRRLPGVQAAATAGFLPGVPFRFQVEYKIDGHAGAGHRILADNRPVSAGYFETMRIPLLQGQACSPGAQPNDLVVNRSFIETYLNGSEAIGHDLAAAEGRDFGRIRGVVGDAREEGLKTAPVPTVYTCLSAPTPFPNYLVRTADDPMALAKTIRHTVHELEPGRSVYATMPLQEHLDDTFAEDRVRTLLLLGFAVVAVALASLGLYGTLSYMGRVRQREVGVRLAMGALRRQIVALFLLKGLQVALLGSLAGLALSVITGHWIASMLYGLSPLDPRIYAGVLVLIGSVATLASVVPAYRSARIEPIEALRED